MQDDLCVLHTPRPNTVECDSPVMVTSHAEGLRPKHEDVVDVDADVAAATRGPPLAPLAPRYHEEHEDHEEGAEHAEANHDDRRAPTANVLYDVRHGRC